MSRKKDFRTIERRHGLRTKVNAYTILGGTFKTLSYIELTLAMAKELSFKDYFS